MAARVGCQPDDKPDCGGGLADPAVFTRLDGAFDQRDQPYPGDTGISCMQSVAIHELPDAEFVALLRQRTEDYLRTVDAWETAYGKYYRLRTPGQLSSDLTACQQRFAAARELLRELLPRARRLCLKHELKYPWELIIRVDLGANPPQTRTASAIGRGERNMVHACVASLEVATGLGVTELPAHETRRGKSEQRRGIASRIYDYFF
jgi:hypothetical protein